MPPINTAQLLTQLTTLEEENTRVKSRSKYSDLSDMPDDDVHDLITRARAAIERIAGLNSAYEKQVQAILTSPNFDGNKLQMLIGVVHALKQDLAAGYLVSFEELIHSAMFADYLEMADYLLSEGYKDPAAVIAGGTLEVHLKQLCSKHGVTLIPSGSTRPKSADQLNAELAGANAYSKLDQKNVTAWQDLRNKAAHGDYGLYSDQQVKLVIDGIREFITRNPA